tara:strand:+ start:100 stop:777 length:678 start_codon:yes stop_codon:yes gene_type:complete
LPKRLSNSQKEEIIKGFINGKSLDALSQEFGYTKLTISRNLKKKFSDDEYSNLLKKSKTVRNSKNKLNKSNNKTADLSTNKTIDENPTQENTIASFDENSFFQSSSFMEIAPLDLNINNETRKELSSIPLDKISFPKMVFIIIDKKTELETKLLKDYPEWHFLPEEDLNSKTIEIYSDLKDAKRNCKKDQKVIKVTNPNVFKIASKIILSKGISRIISDKQLISL